MAKCKACGGSGKVEEPKGHSEELRKKPYQEEDWKSYPKKDRKIKPKDTSIDWDLKKTKKPSYKDKDIKKKSPRTTTDPKRASIGGPKKIWKTYKDKKDK